LVDGEGVEIVGGGLGLKDGCAMGGGDGVSGQRTEGRLASEEIESLVEKVGQGAVVLPADSVQHVAASRDPPMGRVPVLHDDDPDGVAGRRGENSPVVREPIFERRVRSDGGKAGARGGRQEDGKRK
jgi:hypothetical protein